MLLAADSTSEMLLWKKFLYWTVQRHLVVVERVRVETPNRVRDSQGLVQLRRRREKLERQERMSVTGTVFGQDIFYQNQAQIGFQYQHSATTNHMYDLDPYSTEK